MRLLFQRLLKFLSLSSNKPKQVHDRELRKYLEPKREPFNPAKGPRIPPVVDRDLEYRRRVLATGGHPPKADPSLRSSPQRRRDDILPSQVVMMDVSTGFGPTKKIPSHSQRDSDSYCSPHHTHHTPSHTPSDNYDGGSNDGGGGGGSCD
ncbi:hypothetical protein pEaSNUABM46_00058 [Erwinia phage pEa_SNUABM_46]|nr:hypothetical protein pEaSNUABM45_00058 [Erwinia phage pEa_SNUABM_45]QYW04042.1 hypothetical protein pEaSNUABM46_00058 [Erwinia phage pEa_SNUABM_46]